MAAAHAGRHGIISDPGDARLTRSTTALCDDDWMVDTDAAECRVTDVRRLDRYPLEHIFTLPERTHLLLLIAVDDDDRVFGGKANVVESLQNNGRVSLSGCSYFRLKCSLADCHHNAMVVSGVASKMYSLKRFMDDFQFGRAGFKMNFDGTSVSAHITWKRLMSAPRSIMFFGPPLSTSRSFDSIFRDATSLDTLYHLHTSYYDHCFGDVNACLSLQNAYLARRLDIAEKRLTKLQKPSVALDGSLFRREKTKQYLKKVDLAFQKGFESLTTEFKNHSLPIVPKTEMDDLIDEAPAIFGSTWSHLMALRGHSDNTKDGSSRETDQTKTRATKRRDVFFQILSLARVANRQCLTHWALVSNVAAMARGVGRAAESAYAYFGNTVVNATR